MKPLPIGIQTFKDLREGNFLYVDKTKQLYPLIEESKGAYFLSRPRRFGKSLTLSVLDEIFSGNKDLFKGLWIYDSPWEWKKYPVLRFDFSKKKAKTPSPGYMSSICCMRGKNTEFITIFAIIIPKCNVSTR